MKMKKVIVALAGVALAVSAQASLFDWKTAMGQQVYMPGTTTLLASGTAYLIDSAVTSQSAAFAALKSGTDVAAIDGIIDNSPLSSGKVSVKTSQPFTWGVAGDMLSAYFVIVDGDRFYISTTTDGMADASATTHISFIERNASQAQINTTGVYSGAGWYTTVPEPTSGLLMLVGLAGLALRRRRA